MAKQSRALSVFLGLTLALSGCTTQTAPGPVITATDPAIVETPKPTEPEPQPTPTPTSTGNQIQFELADDSNIEVHNFDLGECNIINNIGNAVPCPLRGIIALPTIEQARYRPSPLVVLLHGVREFENVRTDNTYAGFDYLVKQLAAEGYVAVSINIAVDYTFDYGESSNYEWAMKILRTHLDYLSEANNGQDVGYGIDLTNRIDFNRINLVGHSRGAQIADIVARIDHGANPFPWAGETWAAEQWPPTGTIASVTMLGFVEAIGVDGYPANIPYGILVAELDEDARLNDGERLFELAESDPNRTAEATLVILERANHAYFNREFPNRVPGLEVLDRAEQELYAKQFVASFLASVNQKSP